MNSAHAYLWWLVSVVATAFRMTRLVRFSQDRILAKQHKGLFGNYMAARIYKERGNYESAIELFEKMPRDVPFACYAAHDLGYCYLRCARLEELSRLRKDFQTIMLEPSPYLDRLFEELERFKAIAPSGPN